MGFLDSIKRWRLVQQGMSSGAKRRTQSERLVAGAVNRSPWARAGLYALFVIITILLVVNSTTASPFESNKLIASLFTVLFSFVGFAVFELWQKAAPKSRDVMLVFGGILFNLVFIQAISWIPSNETFNNSFRVLVLPYALAPMVHSVLMGRNMGVFSVMLCSLFGALMVPEQMLMYFLVMSLVVGIVVVLMTLNVRRRSSLLRAGFYAGFAVMVMGVCFGFLDLSLDFSSVEPWKALGIRFSAALATSLLISMVVSGILPMLESAFGLTTNISWLELSDLNHKLLKKMQLEVPGTFHHSLVVASLSEAAAESIGANATMCRVCSYFHDIGKLKKPEYFIENQGEVNPHDSLTPTMSALVIIAHVKDGVDMALKHKLNKRIIRVIQEHHGDSLVYYFYRKAQEKIAAENENVEKMTESQDDGAGVDEKNFRYPGPTPSSRESGIISLADAVESASRSLKKASPAKIQSLVDDIVRNRLKDGQLDNCELSLKDIAKVRESFSKTLRSMLHSRIDYPKEGEAADSKSSKKMAKTQRLNSAEEAEVNQVTGKSA